MARTRLSSALETPRRRATGHQLHRNGGQVLLLKDVTRYRFAKKIALHFIAVQPSQLEQLLVSLDALRHNVELQRMRKIDDDRDQRQSTLSRNHVDDERTVNLERVNGKLGQVAERGETGAEVIDGNRDAQCANCE